MKRLRENCNDGRFKRVEERIFKAIGYFLRRDQVTSIEITGLAKKATIWSATFYDHFRNMDDALHKYYHRHDKSMKLLFKEISDKNATVEVAFSKILYYICKHKSYYKTYLHRQNISPILEISKIFRPVLARTWSNYGREKFDLAFKIFSGELFGVIYYWGDMENFDETKISSYVTFLNRLATNTTRRLF